MPGYAIPPYTAVNRTLGAGYTVPGATALTKNLVANEINYSGVGYLAGLLQGRGSVSGTIRLHYHAPFTQPGDGDLVATTAVASDGSWLIENLNPALKYDVIARSTGFNDVITAGVTPAV